MLAELMFHKEQYESAIYHFQQLLDRSPNHYAALAQLIQVGAGPVRCRAVQGSTVSMLCVCERAGAHVAARQV